jgi:hypothetical protein
MSSSHAGRALRASIPIALVAAIAVVSAMFPQSEVRAALPIEQVDVDRNASVNVLDLFIVAHALVPHADVDGDGQINVVDLQHVAVYIDEERAAGRGVPGTPSATPPTLTPTATATATATASATPTATPVAPAPAPTTAGTGRDRFIHPFASDSPWNHPIGGNAVYVPAGIGPAQWATVDVDHIYRLSAEDPLRPLYAPGSWGGPRCSGTDYQGIHLPLPDDLIVPDASNGNTPHNAAAFLMPDGETFVQANPLARCTPGGPAYGWRAPDESVFGWGLRGGHGGSGLSSVGGTIRKGEMIGSAPIRHALKVNLWCERYCSLAGGGYRWPAVRADAYASPSTYGGDVPALRMGSLLAIPPSVSEASLGLETAPGRKLFRALQDYGAYVVDDTAWNAHAIAVDQDVQDEFRAAYGYGMQGTSGAFFRDYMKLFSALHVVDNNAATNVGGGGALRQPLLPPISD